MQTHLRSTEELVAMMNTINRYVEFSYWRRKRARVVATIKERCVYVLD